ncbi:MAG: NAD kinase [Solitalea-like symbiont of Acarus siro]
MKVAIYHSSFNIDSNTDYINELLNNLINRNISVCLHENFLTIIDKINAADKQEIFTDKESLQQSCPDILIRLGGDGTLLNALLLIGDSQIPVIGINLGRLGFISSINKHETDKIIDCLYKRDYEIEKRSLLKLSSEPDKNYFGKFNYALNDFIIKKSRYNSMLKLKVNVDGFWLNNYWGDGIIISTPTGSTAYSISCGGPIILPNTNDFIITPICPHNLSVRPIVVPDNSVIDIEISSDRTSSVTLSIDSRNIETIPAAKLTIQKQNFTLNLIKPKFFDYLNTLRTKLMWGMDYRN